MFWKKKLKSVLVTITNQLFCSGTLQQRLNISDLSKSMLLLIFPTSVKCWELSPIHLAVQCREEGGHWAESKLHKHQNKMGSLSSLSIATRKLQEELENQLCFMSFLLHPLFAVLITWMQIIHNFIALVNECFKTAKMFSMSVKILYVFLYYIVWVKWIK